VNIRSTPSKKGCESLYLYFNSVNEREERELKTSDFWINNGAIMVS